MIIVGLLITTYCNRGIFKAKASVSWPSTKGEIISSEVERSLFQLGRRSTNKYRFYIFKARYQYEVDGEVYNSERVSFLSKYISKGINSVIKDNYAEGKTIEVFYNPEAPSEATLIKGVNKYNKSPFYYFGIIILCAGIAGITVYGLNYLKKGND
jgi:hypothetical protein